MSDFKGKSVIITGASRGIGAATAKAFAEKNATVFLAARSEKTIQSLAAELTTAGHKAFAIQTDISIYSSVENLARKVNQIAGKIDILINNAGVIDPISRIETSDPDAWGKAVDINLKGVYYGYRAVVPFFIEQKKGTIINISSGAATKPLDGWSHYCATKAGVLALTRCGHAELNGYNIRSIGLSPGTVATDMQDKIKKSGINPVSQLNESIHISPHWVAKSLLYLAGPAGDDWLGHDFSLKTNEGRQLVGLPLLASVP